MLSPKRHNPSTNNCKTKKMTCSTIVLIKFLICFPRKFSKTRRGDGKWGSFQLPSVCTYTPLYLIYPPIYPRGLKKSVLQMMLLMPLAEVPLFYPRTCGSKARRGERKHTAARQNRGGKKSFLYLTRKTPLFLCIGRGEKHMGMEVAWPGA